MALFSILAVVLAAGLALFATSGGRDAQLATVADNVRKASMVAIETGTFFGRLMNIINPPGKTKRAPVKSRIGQRVGPSMFDEDDEDDEYDDYH